MQKFEYDFNENLFQGLVSISLHFRKELINIYWYSMSGL